MYPPNKLSKTTVVLHWLVAIAMIFMTLIGLYMEDFDSQLLFDSHTTFGWIILIIILPRVIWRLKKGWPQPAGNYSQVEHLMGKLVHWLLLLATLLMPVSGIVMSITGGHGLSFYDIHLISENPDPNNLDEVLPLSPILAEASHTIHGLIGEFLLFIIALHVIGAIKHHIIDRDETLRRMLGLTPRNTDLRL